MQPYVRPAGVFYAVQVLPVAGNQNFDQQKFAPAISPDSLTSEYHCSSLSLDMKTLNADSPRRGLKLNFANDGIHAAGAEHSTLHEQRQVSVRVSLVFGTKTKWAPRVTPQIEERGKEKEE
jgi:hypothetical protein